MRRFLSTIISVTCLLSMLVSCDEFYEVNDDPNKPSQSASKNLLAPVLGYWAKQSFEHGEFVAYITQQVATYGGGDTRRDRWDYLNVNRIGHWRVHYHDVGVNASNLIATSVEEENENYEGIGRVVLALSTLITSDVFGDMPLSEAFVGNTFPKYDDHQEIYTWVGEELDRAIAALEVAKTQEDQNTPLYNDFIYGGDLDKWIALAHAVKARMLLHYVPNVSAPYDEILSEVEMALSNFETAAYEYTNGAETSLEIMQCQWGPNKAKYEWDYWQNALDASGPTYFFLHNLMGYDPLTADYVDPRLPYLMTSRDVLDLGDGTTKPAYYGMRSGEGIDGTKDNDLYPYMYGNYQTRDDASQFILMEEELHFIKSEVLFMKGQFNESLAALQEGVSVHMNRAGVPSDEAEAFLRSEKMPQNGTALRLSHIMQQKVVALYLQGEVWADMRRHGFDTNIYEGLERPVDLAYYWEDNTGEHVWLQRFPYDPETEEIYNRGELLKRDAFQNPAWMYQPVFWAKKIEL
ncbi:SusD/RagB family nutrient-binding outer membrane lipoprotein [Sediminitomix flava]|uniref:SusD-like starch-binding protein associating with outer membrane n=1 Tax=Sediminitomix flava TaxID=379075 RepID=A0A316A2C4_SEDFL|nr:SusD/RagB family nutrient-binding outer membrane lipoprotein [Sediminitomix flava]PWJ43847.1 SusD-like starch-binding protein associating with outer membrane [Sediminitomix flava]